MSEPTTTKNQSWNKLAHRTLFVSRLNDRVKGMKVGLSVLGLLSKLSSCEVNAEDGLKDSKIIAGIFTKTP